jgi:hypothetical protein
MLKTRTHSIFDAMDNRYPDLHETKLMTEYAQSLDHRLQAISALEQHEEAILQETLTRIFEKYPKVEMRIEGREKTHRDLALILRYSAQAMLRDDVRFLEDKLLYWLATILHAFKFGDNCLHDSYVFLNEIVHKHLSESHYLLLKPCLERVIELVPEKENQHEA